MLSLEKLRADAEYILKTAQQNGAEQCYVSVHTALGNHVGFRTGKIEALERVEDFSLALTVYRKHRKGSIAISDRSEQAMTHAVKTALSHTEFTEDDPDFGIAAAEDYARCCDDDWQALQLWSNPPDIDALTQLASSAEAAALACDPRIVSHHGAQAYGGESVFYVATSNGFRGGARRSSVSVSVSALAREANDQQSAYDYDHKILIDDLRAAADIGKTAAQKALAALKPRAVKTDVYPVLFVPELASGLMGHLLSALGGYRQYRKLGFLPDSLGKTVLPAWLSLHENPLLPKGATSALFDGEGIAVRNPVLIHEGTVEHYLLGSYAARRLHLTPSGNSDGVHNLQLLATPDHVLSLSDLYQQMGRGLVVTELMGQGVDLLTGNYSRGARGFWVENGEIAYPVTGVTIAGSLPTMLQNIMAIGDDIRSLGAVHAPSILLREMTVADGE